MADITTIKTRILNKYDLLDNYGSFTPLKGEICIVEIPTDTSESGLTPPAIGIKVGDGKNSFDKLNWIQAIAGDISAEIKALTGVTDIDAKIAALTSNRKLATIEELNNLNENINSISTKIGTTSIGTEGTTITSAIKALQDTVGASGENSLGSQVIELTERMGKAETDLTELQGRVTTAEGKITNLEGEMDVVQAATAGFDASSTIAAKFATVEETIGGISSTANTNKAAIAVLNGDKNTSGSVAHTAAAAVAEIVAGADTNFDTLKEIADWIKSDTTGAAEMANDIAEMQGLLGVVEGNALPKTVDARIEEAIADANLGQYATTEALGGINNRVTALEGTANDASTVNSVPGAKKYAEEKASAAQAAAIASAATDATTKANAAQAAAEATAAADATTKANAAQAAAEGKVTELANGAVKSNTEAIGSINTTLNAMNVTDTVNGVVTKVDQNNGKITVTHKKITMDEFDPNTTFIFDCGNASRDT